MEEKKIYFASDFHLGSGTKKENRIREEHVVKWLNEIEKDAQAIYLVGDIFDFWFEYKKVVPKGFIRFLGKLANLTDKGIQVHLFVGNHDLWMKKYLNEEIGIIIHTNSEIITEQAKKIFISHGDGLGKGDYIYKYLKKIFTSKLCQWAFTRLHPNLAFGLAHKWSSLSKKKQTTPFISREKEILFEYCQEQQKQNPIDYYIMGHRHIPLELKIKKLSIGKIPI